MDTLQEVDITIRNILLIDDEVSVREVVELCLKDLGGWNVVVADSPFDGLHKAATEHTDAIVLDISMRGMTMFKFLEQLRNNPATQAIPVILLSAKARWLDSQILRQYRISGIILKPFDPVLLPTQISQLLGWD